MHYLKPENSNLLRSTAETVFGSCEGSHEALLGVSAGICGKAALAHASQHLQSAHEIAKRISSDAPVADAGLHWATVWAVDAARSLVRALIDTEDAEQIPTETHGSARSNVCITRQTAFGDAVGGPAIFNVRASVQAEDALVHTSLYLQAAYATADEVCSWTKADDKGLHWALLHSIEAALALVEAVQDGDAADGDMVIRSMPVAGEASGEP